MTPEADKLADDGSQSDAELIAVIEKRLLVKAPNRECPFCANRDWFALDLTSQTVAAVFEKESVETYTFACTNCGFIRQHIRRIVDGEIGGGVSHARSE